MTRVRPKAGFLDDRQPALAYGSLDGDGPPLMLVHGLAARWQVFQPMMLRLRESFAQYAVDLHGGSDRCASYTLDGFVDDVVSFVESVATGPVHLYGHSLGGSIALVVAARRPELVASAVVADSTITPRVTDENAISYLAELPLAVRSMAKSTELVDRLVLEGFRDGTTLSAFSKDVILPQVRCPVLLLQADRDCGGLMTDEDVEDSLRLLPRGRHEYVEGIGHGLHVEDAPAVIDLLQDFWTAEHILPAPAVAGDRA